MKDINLVYNGRLVTLRNRWESLTPPQYLRLVQNLIRMAGGHISPGEVRIRLLCDLMQWNMSKIRDEDTIATLIAIASRLTFLFNIDQQGRFLINLSFCAQLVPRVTIHGHTYEAYHVCTDFNQLTCSLTALQYLEARALIPFSEGSASDAPSPNNQTTNSPSGQTADTPRQPISDDAQTADALPFLAAILYCPGAYDSQRAHLLAKEFQSLTADILLAISWNFQAFNTFLFTKTEFSLLTKFKQKTPSAITTDAADALYDLAADGLGNNQEIEQMNILTYLRVLRKKTIDTVRQMRALKMDTPSISIESGLPVEVINDII